MAVARSSSTDTRVRNALEAIYKQFAVAVPAAIEGCPCCTTKRGVDVLLATPLRELDGQTLWRYVSDVFYTVGNENDFRYFLPRILDISVYDPANANYPEVVLSKLTLAHWRSWPADERQVIEQFMDAWFDLALERDLAEADEGWIGREAEGVLCGVARAGLSLLPWLVRFHEPAAAPVLADLKARFPAELSAFWEEAHTGYEELATILVQGRC